MQRPLASPLSTRARACAIRGLVDETVHVDDRCIVKRCVAVRVTIAERYALLSEGLGARLGWRRPVRNIT